MHSEPESRRISPEPTNIAGQYHGPTSAHSFLGRAWRRLDRERPQPSVPAHSDSDAAANVSIFSFGDKHVTAIDASTFSWPHPAAARELLQRYFDFSAPTYRVLHRPTVSSWVSRVYEDQRASDGSARPLPVAAQAVVLMVFATASMFQVDMDGNIRDADPQGWKDSELYYNIAQQRLSNEVGPPTLESVQARFLTVLYLLSSSRANKAWFTHGVMVQLMMALGLHRKRAVIADGRAVDHITRECQKRILWSSYTVDKYLSFILGRPRLLQDEDIDQEFPSHTNDEDLTTEGVYPKPGRDCIMDAPIYHTRLAQILARASKEQYAIQPIPDKQQIEASVARTDEIFAWQAQLPPFISGAIQASSLVPVFRRQQTVLRLAHFHAIMFVTRPLLVRNYARKLPEEYRDNYIKQLRRCVIAAKEAVDLIMVFVREDQLFPAFWYAQYIAFNAISIIYIYLTQVSKARLSIELMHNSSEGTPPLPDTQVLLKLAEGGQHHLSKASIRNAPAWNYSIILEGLRIEANRLMSSRQNGLSMANQIQSGSTSAARTNTPSQLHVLSPPAERNGMVFDSSSRTYVTADLGLTSNNAVDGTQVSQSDIDMMGIPSGPGLFDLRTDNMFEGFTDGMGDEDLGLDFWPQLDSLPLCKCVRAQEDQPMVLTIHNSILRIQRKFWWRQIELVNFPFTILPPHSVDLLHLREPVLD